MSCGEALRSCVDLAGDDRDTADGEHSPDDKQEKGEEDLLVGWFLFAGWLRVVVFRTGGGEEGDDGRLGPKGMHTPRRRPLRRRRIR